MNSQVQDTTKPRTFAIRVSNGLLAREHYAKMGDAVWFFLWLLDKVSYEKEGEDGSRIGQVYRGKPVSDSSVARDFGCSSKTVRRWRERLRTSGYIGVRRTPIGYAIWVYKSKRRRDGERQNLTNKTGNSDVPQRAITTKSDIPVREGDVPQRAIQLRHCNDTDKKPQQGAAASQLPAWVEKRAREICREENDWADKPEAVFRKHRAKYCREAVQWKIDDLHAEHTSWDIRPPDFQWDQRELEQLQAYKRCLKELNTLLAKFPAEKEGE